MDFKHELYREVEVPSIRVYVGPADKSATDAHCAHLIETTCQSGFSSCPYQLLDLESAVLCLGFELKLHPPQGT